MNLHPEKARERIKAGVKESIQDIKRYKPYKLKPPYTLVVNFVKEEMAESKKYLPGVKRTGERELSYKSKDILDIVRYFYLKKN